MKPLWDVLVALALFLLGYMALAYINNGGAW